MDKNPRFLARSLAVILLPLTLAVTLPLLFVFAFLFYMNVIVRAFLHLGTTLLQRKPTTSAEPARQPHFLDAPAPKIVPESPVSS